MTRLIAIASGKGGVGKTTTTVNLGVALSSFHKNVIIVDANLTTPNIGLHLGIHNPAYTLNDALEGKASIVDAIALHESGVRVIPAGMNLKHLRTTKPQKLWDVALDLFGTSDIVLLDTPAGLETGAKSVLDASEEVLIVTNPEMPAVTDALKTIRIAYASGANVIGVVLTKTRGGKDSMDKQNIESILDTNIIAEVPFDHDIPHTINMKSPILVRKPNSASAQAYKKLAADLLGVDFKTKAAGWPVLNALKTIFGVKD
jgi:septum site-determining protein MinD|tara:strand:+ start:645 stop:1421 length:777 start_codon:yes stop_codon:yes gene_type:complete